MPLAKCRRCGGDGKFSDQNPTNNRRNWCLGCQGDGNVNVADPSMLCNRCGGDGKFSDQNPTNNRRNWCAGCQGSGYAS